MELRLGKKVDTPAVVLIVLVTALLVAATVFWICQLPMGIDSSVYRAGATALLRGDSIYGRLPNASGLPFIYPPIAAILFTPLVILPATGAWVVLDALSLLGLAVVIRVCSGEWPGRGATATGLLVGLLVLEPVWRTLALGQINIVLMALVVLDVLALPNSRYRGVLVGVAAAVKLTPLVFVPYLFLVGRRADAARALGTFAALNIAGWLIMPGDTIRFWKSQLLGGVGVTTESWYGNQSLNGLIQRLSHHASWAFAAAVIAGLVCVCAALPLARRLHARGEELGALLVMAFAGVLASPISWTHHWVWVAPLACLLVRRAPRPVLGLAALAVVFTGWTYALVPTANGQELSWTPVQILLGNAYVFVGLAAAVVLWWAEITRFARFPTRTRKSPPAPDHERPVWPVGDRHGS